MRRPSAVVTTPQHAAEGDRVAEGEEDVTADEIQMPSANQSCTDVAPVRHESGNGENQYRIDPVPSMSTSQRRGTRR